MNYWLKNVQIETGYKKIGEWLSGTETKLVAIKVVDGRFDQIIDQNDFHEEAGIQTVDGENRLILPSLVEKHCHLDKSKLGTPWVPVTPAKDLVERFETEVPFLDSLELSIEDRAEELIQLELAHGVTKFRSHVDVEPMTGLRYFDAIQGVAKAKDFEIELVVFPQHGLLRSNSSQLVEEALQKGAQYIGGVDPYTLDQDYLGSLAETFRLADKYHVGVDIHLHDRGEAGIQTINEIIRLTKVYHLQDKVYISHAFGLNDFHGEARRVCFTDLAKEKIHIVSSVPITAGTVPPLLELVTYGVQVHLGCDNINDCWSPYGDGSLQQKLARLGELFGVKGQAELTQLLGLVTDGVTPLDGNGQQAWPKVGLEADYLLTKASCTAEFVATQTPVDVSFSAGKKIYQR